MSNFENLWGQSYDDVSEGFKLGINDKVFLHDIKYEEGQYGPQLYVEWHKGQRAVKNWYSIPSIEEVQSGRIDMDKYKELITRFNSIIKHLVCNYVSEETYQAHLKAYPNAQAFVNDVLTLIPANFQELEGQLILGYNKKGYLNPPVSIKMTGPFWSVGGKFDLRVSDIILNSKPKEADSNSANNDDLGLGGATPTSLSNDDLPF